MLEASPLKNSYIGKIFHDRYQNYLQQPDGSITLASLLNETLSKLKGRKPNKPILKPLNVQTKTAPLSSLDADGQNERYTDQINFQEGRYNIIN